jgi:hypothetical protein
LVKGCFFFLFFIYFFSFFKITYLKKEKNKKKRKKWTEGRGSFLVKIGFKLQFQLQIQLKQERWPRIWSWGQGPDLRVSGIDLFLGNQPRKEMQESKLLP